MPEVRLPFAEGFEIEITQPRLGTAGNCGRGGVEKEENKVEEILCKTPREGERSA